MPGLARQGKARRAVRPPAVPLRDARGGCSPSSVGLCDEKGLSGVAADELLLVVVVIAVGDCSGWCCVGDWVPLFVLRVLHGRLRVRCWPCAML